VPVNVMIVDDSAFMRDMIKNILKDSSDVGEILEASDGEEAIEKYKLGKPQIVFMDIMMPKVNGIEALKAIMEADPNAKVIMCTSIGQEKIISDAVEAGAKDFITKPFKPEEISAIIQANKE